MNKAKMGTPAVLNRCHELVASGEAFSAEESAEILGHMLWLVETCNRETDKAENLRKSTQEAIDETNDLRRKLGVVDDHARTIQMLRSRCTEHTRREQELEQRIVGIVRASKKELDQSVARGKKIHELQNLTERLRKRGNTLARVARSHKDDYTSACQTIVKMHEAATGRWGAAPKRGVVEDMEDVRKEGVAALRCLERIVAKINDRRNGVVGTTLVRRVCADILSEIKTIIDEENAPARISDSGKVVADAYAPGTVTRDTHGWSTTTEWSPPKCKACGIERGEQGRLHGVDVVEIDPGLHTCSKFARPDSANDAAHQRARGASLTRKQAATVRAMIDAALRDSRSAGAPHPNGYCARCNSVLIVPGSRCPQGCRAP